MPGKDTRTRFQGVFARHQQHCAVGHCGRCNCKPSYYGACYDRARKKYVRTKLMPTTEAARNARADLAQLLERGEVPVTNALRLTDARERYMTAAREGRALNKHGHRYKPRAIDNIEESLVLHVEPVLGSKRLSHIRRGDMQAIVDDLAPKLSGSRVRSVVNAARCSTDGPRIGTSQAMIRRLLSGCQRWTRPRSNASPHLPNSQTCWPCSHWRTRSRTHSPAMEWDDERRLSGSSGRTST
jgi:hypothetical protein